MAYDSAPAQDRSALNARGKKAKERADACFQRQQIYLPLWQAQAEIFYPERADFTMTYAAADERYEGIFTSDPQVMRRDLANKLGAMIRPRGKQWFNVTIRPNHVMANDDVRRWCETATATMRNIIYSPAARFAKALSASDHDYVTFGSAIVAHPYNSDQSGILFQCLHPRDCAYERNHEGVVDTMYQKMKFTLRQIAQMFGKESMPKEWIDKLDKNGGEKMTIMRCVHPLEDDQYEGKERRPREANFTSLYVACGTSEDCTLGEGFFLSFPFTVREWMGATGDDYARSPCTSVGLSDARTLNSVQESLLTGVEMRVDPPKYYVAGSIEGPMELRAGGLTAIDDEYDMRNGDPIKSMEIGEPRYAMEFKRDLQENMGRVFFESILKLPDGEMTAYEVSERIEMYSEEAAPIFEPMEAENADLMNSVFARALPKGAFGRVMEDGMIEGLPELLQGADIDFEFETPLTKALSRLKASQFDQVTARANTLIATQHPKAIAAIDNIDWDEALRDGMSGIAPASWMKRKEDLDAERQAEAEAQAQAEQQAQAMEAGKIAANANPENIRMAEQAITGEA